MDSVTVRFDHLVALDAISWELRAGESAALMGPNGSGKTTLLHCLAGLREPTAGSVTVPRGFRPVAYVQQRHESHPWMPLTVDEVIRMGRYGQAGLVGRLGAPDRALLADLAERLEIAGLARRQFGELSGGQRQRVLLAQALAQEPRLLLLDEPVTGLDLASQQRIFDLIDDEAAAGVAVVLSTHHLDEARHCDQVLLLDNDLVAAGPPEAVLTAPNLQRAFAGRTLPTEEGRRIEVIDEHGHGTADQEAERPA